MLGNAGRRSDVERSLLLEAADLLRRSLDVESEPMTWRLLRSGYRVAKSGLLSLNAAAE
jgi:hypothetical protein